MIESNLLPSKTSCWNCEASQASEELNPLLLWFRKGSQEQEYRGQTDPLFKIYIVCAFGLFLCIFLIQAISTEM